MQTACFVFAYDLEDEGYAQVLENVQQRAQAQAVTLACSYHHARDIFPHNPVRKVRFHEGGAVFFRPSAERYAGLKIQPYVSSLAAKRDPLATCVAEAERRGMAVRAWTTNTHNTTLGSRYPECTIQNAFGDPYLTSLCPANPDVRAYLRALSADIARYQVQSILLESISYLAFDHGYHHERSFVPLSPAIKFLLGLCFCQHCTAAARAAGVDSERVRQLVQREVQQLFDDQPGGLVDLPLDHAHLAALAGGELGGLLQVRQSIVTSLVAEVSEAVSAVGSTQVIFLDMSAAKQRTPADSPAPAQDWQDGTDLPALARACHGISMLGYTAELRRLDSDLAAYRTVLPPGTPLAVCVRPMEPDCSAAGELAQKVALLREAGISWMDVYHYGLMRLSNLDWVGQALQGA